MPVFNHRIRGRLKRHALMAISLAHMASVACKRPDSTPGSELGNTMANLSDINVHQKCLTRIDSLNKSRGYDKADGTRFLVDEKLRLKLCDFNGSKEPMSTAPVDCYKTALKENLPEGAAVEKCRPK